MGWIYEKYMHILCKKETLVNAWDQIFYLFELRIHFNHLIIIFFKVLFWFFCQPTGYVKILIQHQLRFNRPCILLYLAQRQQYLHNQMCFKYTFVIYYFLFYNIKKQLISLWQSFFSFYLDCMLRCQLISFY